MKAKDVMTPRVLTVSENATVLDAAQLMVKRRISGLPVVDANGGLVGMITEGDLMHRTEIATGQERSGFLAFLIGPGRAAEDYVRAHGRLIKEVMSVDPVSVTEDTGLDRIVSLFDKRKIRRVAVLRDGHIVGIVTRANLLKAFVKNAQYPKATNVSDGEIRSRILAEMEKSAWAPTAMVEVVVDEGVVKLTGTILDERDRGALRVLAENTPGVRGVQDDMIWVEPYSGMTLGAADGSAAA